MKQVIHVCDICKTNYPDAKIRYKYRAKEVYHDWYGNSWYRIELCAECMDLIAKEVKKQ